MIDTFIKKFTERKIESIKIGNRFFNIGQFLKNLVDEIDKNPEYCGTFLGGVSKGRFKPAFGLLEMLKDLTDRKLIVKDIGEMDFLYGKNLRDRHIEQYPGRRGLVIVLNANGECLGYGNLIGNKGDKGVVLKNLKDKGEFIRKDLS